jgi:prepilin-type N-terminal cleavage/methylation domain-containing protein
MKKNNKGFSLVELIIVIAIMAILIGVLAPNLMRYIERTRVSNDIQTIDQLRKAITTAYMDANNPRVETEALTAVGSAGGTITTFFGSSSSITRDVATTLKIANASTVSGSDIQNFIGQQLRSRGASVANLRIHYLSSTDTFVIGIDATDSTGTNTPGSGSTYSAPSGTIPASYGGGTGHNIFVD